MKRIIFILTMMLFVQGIHAQQYYGQVQDRDGYTNIRRGPSTKHAIVRRYQSGDYLYYTPQNNGWSKVYSGKNSNTYMGYMHTSRIVRINPNSNNNSSSSSSSSFKYGQELLYIAGSLSKYMRTGPGDNYRKGYCYTGYWDNNKFERVADPIHMSYDEWISLTGYIEIGMGRSLGESKNGYTLVFVDDIFCADCEQPVGWFPTKYLRIACSKCCWFTGKLDDGRTCPKCRGKGYIE